MDTPNGIRSEMRTRYRSTAISSVSVSPPPGTHDTRAQHRGERRSFAFGARVTDGFLSLRADDDVACALSALVVYV